MLLRRVIAHVKAQNWTAVGLDFVIVVLGVFIGIQFGNWNDARIERSMERQYVLRLLEDMQRSEAAIGQTNTWLARQVEAEGPLLESLRRCAIAEADREQVTWALGSLGKYAFVRLDRELVDELRASGRIGVIGNSEIRAAIATMIHAADYQARSEEQFRAHATPWVVYARRFYYFDAPEGAPLDARWETWGALRFNVQRVCRDEEFIAAVGNTREATRNLVAWNEEIRTNVADVRALLEQEAAARGWADGE